MKRIWKNRFFLNLGMEFESRMEKCLWKVQSRFYPGDLMTRTGDQEISSVSGRVGTYAHGAYICILHLRQFSFNTMTQAILVGSFKNVQGMGG